MKSYVLPEKLRSTLTRPIGELLAGSDIDLGEVLGEVIAKEKPAKLILVGDTVSRRAIERGVLPDVIIVDGMEKRRPSAAYSYPGGGRVVRARNHAGRIEPEAQVAVERAIRGEADRVEIEGEEDLLALVAARTAPAGSVIVYGQPNVGVVIVRVSAKTKANVEAILEEMSSSSSD